MLALHLALLLFELLIGSVISLEQLHMPVLELHRAVCHAVEEIAVMRNDQRRTCKIAQEALEPLHTLDI